MNFALPSLSRARAWSGVRSVLLPVAPCTAWATVGMASPAVALNTPQPAQPSNIRRVSSKAMIFSLLVCTTPADARHVYRTIEDSLP